MIYTQMYMTTKKKLLEAIKKQKLYTALVKKALKQAEESHGEQKRDDGGGVLGNHIYPLAYSVLERYEGEGFLEDLVVLSLLHDTMEDDENFDEKICLEIFGSKVCENVKNLTKDERKIRRYSGNNENLYELLKFFANKEYIEKVNGSNEICKIVKLEDRINNLKSIEKLGTDPKNFRYVMESDTLFVSMAKKTKSFDYVPLLKREIVRLSS